MKVQVWCPHPPALSGGRVIGGQVTCLKINHQEVPADTVLPPGTTLGDIQWHRPQVAIPQRIARTVVKVTGSKGKVYTVVREGTSVSCTCPGFQYRRFCKHTGAV